MHSVYLIALTYFDTIARMFLYAKQDTFGRDANYICGETVELQRTGDLTVIVGSRMHFVKTRPCLSGLLLLHLVESNGEGKKEKMWLPRSGPSRIRRINAAVFSRSPGGI